MALNEASIAQKIDTLLGDTASLAQPEAKAKFKNDLAKIIVDAIKSATITIPSSAINVTGSNGPATNPAPIPLTNAIT